MDGVQSQNDIVVLQFVDEHGDWVELVVLIRFHDGRSISGDGEAVRAGDRTGTQEDVGLRVDDIKRSVVF